MKKLVVVLAMLVAPVFAQTTTTFTTAASSNPCALVLTQPQSYRCFQATSFNSAPGFSLYLPGLILENCSIAYGTFVLQPDGTYLQQAVASCYQGKSVALSTTYSKHCVTQRSRYGTHTLCSYIDIGGSGTVTSQ